jgi:FkbM family methyltransferase
MIKTYLWERFGKISYVFKILKLGIIVDIGRLVVKKIYCDNLTIKTEDILITGSFDQRLYLSKVRDGIMEPFTRKVFIDLIKPGMVVLDIGSCLGLYSVLSARRLDGKGKVYSIEPDYRNYEYLVKNINQNNLSHMIIPVDKALSDKSETITFNLGSGMRTGSSRYIKLNKRNTDGSIQVEAISLDDFLDKDICADVIKMDVEGSEIDALDGMKDLIKRSLDKLIMIVECNPKTLYFGGASPEKLIDKLRSLSLEVMILDEDNKILSPVTDRTYKDFYPDNENHYFIENLFCYKKGRDIKI